MKINMQIKNIFFVIHKKYHIVINGCHHHKIKCINKQTKFINHSFNLLDHYDPLVALYTKLTHNIFFICSRCTHIYTHHQTSTRQQMYMYMSKYIINERYH